MHIDIRVFLKILGILTLIEGISMLLCTPAAVYYKEWSTASALLSHQPDLHLCRFCSSGASPL